MIKYRHYKNKKLYQYIALATNEADKKQVVVYKCLETNVYYVRPAMEFFGTVYVDEISEAIQRFEKVD